jgi:hypothetical protein
MSDVAKDYQHLLVYGQVSMYGSREEPEVAAWLAAIRQRAESDGLAVDEDASFNQATREHTIAKLVRQDGRMPHAEEESRRPEQEWGETLDAARHAAGVGRHTPSPPQELRADLSQIYETGYLPVPDDNEWRQTRWQALLDAAAPTGIPIVGRQLGDAVWEERSSCPAAAWPTQEISCSSCRCSPGSESRWKQIGAKGLRGRVLGPAARQSERRLMTRQRRHITTLSSGLRRRSLRMPERGSAEPRACCSHCNCL